MMKKYCKSYLFMLVIFMAVSFFAKDNLLFVFYPCLLCGMIPVNLLAYDEQSRFTAYSGTLPCTKAQIVSGKYIIGILVQCAVILLTSVTQGIKMTANGSFRAQELFVTLVLGFCFSSLVSPISLPFMFKFGTEKGRMAHLFMIGAVCAGTYILSSSTFVDIGQIGSGISLNGALLAICAVCAAIYALSWYLSIVFYRKREI